MIRERDCIKTFHGEIKTIFPLPSLRIFSKIVFDRLTYLKLIGEFPHYSKITTQQCEADQF